jgi:DNA-binding winged helix-turn-helix (wHTH) protein
MDSAPIRFADFEFDARTHELRRNGRAVPIERQPALALSLLVTRAGRLVTRDDLRASIWPAGTFVDFDRGLNYCLRQVRLALGDDAKAPRFIETVPRQGYRFIAAIRIESRETAAEKSAASATPPRPRWRLVAAATLAVTAVGAAAEWGPRNEAHHRIAVGIAQTVHNWLF